MALFETLQTRYPDLAFYLTIEQPPFSICEGGHLLPESLEGYDLLYFFGLDRGESFYSLRKWLEEKSERALIFLEDEWGRISTLLKSPHVSELIAHPQVHLKYVSHPGDWDATIEEMAECFPCDRVHCLALSCFSPSQFAKYRLQLMRSSGAISALYSDVLYGHKLFENLYANFPKLMGGFDANLWENAFAGVPAIICGAGPSLEKSFVHLRRLQNQALILAGGSAIPALLNAGIQPHLALALDPNVEELERLSDLSTLKAPLLCSPRLQKNVLDQFKGQVGYLYSATGGLAEEWLRKTLQLPDHLPIGLSLGREAFSVTTLSLAYAHFLGCDPIILTGVDLAFTGGKRYAKGVQASKQSMSQAILDQRVKRKDKKGRFVDTLLKWIMEADALSAFAHAHPGRRYIDATSAGLFVKGFERGLLERSFAPLDLFARIESQIQLTRFSPLTGWENTCKELKESLIRCIKLCKELQKGPQKKTKLQFDLSEEKAYSCFLEGVDAALERLLLRYIPKEESKREIAKWKEMEEAASRLLLHIH